MHNKRALQSQILALDLLYWVEVYYWDEVATTTSEVAQMFNCSRSTASRIMDYADKSTHMLYVVYADTPSGKQKLIAPQADLILKVDAVIWGNILLQAIRNKGRLGLSDDTMKRLHLAVDNAWRIQQEGGDHVE